MELWRRLILLICVCAAIWLAYLADLSPKIIAMPMDFAEKWKQLAKHTRTKNSLIPAWDLKQSASAKLNNKK